MNGLNLGTSITLGSTRGRASSNTEVSEKLDDER